jgi:hypothetical protein
MISIFDRAPAVRRERCVVCNPNPFVPTTQAENTAYHSNRLSVSVFQCSSVPVASVHPTVTNEPST